MGVLEFIGWGDLKVSKYIRYDCFHFSQELVRIVIKMTILFNRESEWLPPPIVLNSGKGSYCKCHLS